MPHSAEYTAVAVQIAPPALLRCIPVKVTMEERIKGSCFTVDEQKNHVRLFLGFQLYEDLLHFFYTC